MVMNDDVWCMTTEMTPKVSNGVAPSIRSRDYKDPPVVMIPSGVQMDWNQTGIMFPLRARDYKEPAVVLCEVTDE